MKMHFPGCEAPRGETMLYSGTVPESYITGHTLVYEDQTGGALPAWESFIPVLGGNLPGPMHTVISQNVFIN